MDDFTSAFAARLSLDVDSDSRSGSLRSIISRQDSIKSPLRQDSVKSPLSRQDSRANTTLTKLIDTTDPIITIPHVLQTLSLSTRSATRNSIGHNEREILLAHLYRMIISPSWEIYMGPYGANDEDFALLVSLHSTADSSFEWETWLHCTVSYACVAIDEVATDVVDSLFPILLSQITPEEPNKRMESALWAFMACLLFVYHGAENHGMLQHAATFAHYADIINDDASHSACIYTVALALSLAAEGGREVNGTELIESIRLTLELKGKNQSKLAAAVLAGVLHEVDHDLDFSLIKQALQPLLNEGTRKAGKKGKFAKNLFNDVYNSLNNNSTEIELRLKNKTINVSTWSAYVRVQILQFVFTNETNAWLSRSREIRDMLKVRFGDEEEDEEEGYNDEDDDEVVGQTFTSSIERKVLDKERSIKLKKERLEKVLK
ncbi:hypothetical protein CANINC_000719 [Pichia inconspicua]|uniref:Interferon-related developmental regulator N-terminal domain-containing protein n=1 Tax=Pichia inconspicua TaxID=52247 RepID=A0A4T0X650_9ASCO|nr:hypothetical protein CANINC_000719 [[Candida] inconspicua]